MYQLTSRAENRKRRKTESNATDCVDIISGLMHCLDFKLSKKAAVGSQMFHLNVKMHLTVRDKNGPF